MRSCDLEVLIEATRARVGSHAPQLSGLFEIYAGEARFGYSLIQDDLHRLRRNASILEVGAGMLLLSCHLQHEGFTVTALEPLGTGFSHLDQLGALVLDHAREHGFAPELLPIGVEDLTVSDRFDFSFSINVMEHVSNVETALKRVHTALRVGGWHRFWCPNYAFPYEPHFNLPTLGSKTLTERVLRRRIMRSTRVPEPAHIWNSLNWISVREIRRICRCALGEEPHFVREVFLAYVERALNDPEFQSRRSPWMKTLLAVLHYLGLSKAIYLIPLSLMPTIDCTIRRTSPPVSGSTLRLPLRAR